MPWPSLLYPWYDLGCAFLLSYGNRVSLCGPGLLLSAGIRILHHYALFSVLCLIA